MSSRKMCFSSLMMILTTKKRGGCFGIFGRKCDQVGLATSFVCIGTTKIPLFKFYSVGSSVNGSNVLHESYVDFDGDTYDSDILNVSNFVRRPRSCAHFFWHWRTEFPNKFEGKVLLTVLRGASCVAHCNPSTRYSCLTKAPRFRNTETSPRCC